LRTRYTEHAEYLGRVTDEELARLYARAAALVVPNVEEFGIAAVEAQAAGRPVVAIDAGGARETVIHGRTGILVPPDDRRALEQALRGDFTRFDGRDIQVHAQLFSRRVFEVRMLEIVGSVRRSPKAAAPAVTA
jgi:glycosyltransferase involved in cell wall biosynthesis